MKRTLLFWALIAVPFLLMVAVNETSERPTNVFKADRCTRYCHNKGCPHTATKYAHTQSALIRKAQHLYAWNIHALQSNGLGLSYFQINIVLYVILAPILMGLLLWGAIRKKRPCSN